MEIQVATEHAAQKHQVCRQAVEAKATALLHKAGPPGRLAGNNSTLANQSRIPRDNNPIKLHFHCHFSGLFSVYNSFHIC